MVVNDDRDTSDGDWNCDEVENGKGNGDGDGDGNGERLIPSVSKSR